MKLASLRDGSRDGQLVVVSRDLRSAHYATGIATRLQQALDDWGFMSPQLQDIADALDQGRARHAFPFDPALCMAPLPRAFQWVSGSAYPSHSALLRQAAGIDAGQATRSGPMLIQGASDDLAGARDEIGCASQKLGVDFGAGLAVITGDVPRGATPEQALEGVRLLMLANEVVLRELEAIERAAGHGFVQSRPMTAFSPVAATPDELGSTWRNGRVHLRLDTTWNGKQVGLCDAGAEMGFHFGQLIAQACATRRVRAGSVIGSGVASLADRSRGFGAIAEKRAQETLEHGEPRTAYLSFGDDVRIEMKDAAGASVFGAIEQSVVQASADTNGGRERGRDHERGRESGGGTPAITAPAST